jgi:hypothetical protein
VWDARARGRARTERNVTLKAQTNDAAPIKEAIGPDLAIGDREENAADGDAGFGLADERMLGEMGNYFHKLYYWTEYLKTHPAGAGHGDAAAVDMLEGTVERLEHFMRMILEYFAPPRLCFNRIGAADLVGGLACRLPGRKLRIEGLDEHGAMGVLADPGLMAQAMRTVFECVAATLVDEDEIVARIQSARRREFAGIEIEFVAGRGLHAGSRLMRGIEMAVAEKFLQMHGGEVFERSDAVGRIRTLVVFLPIYA